MTDDRVSHRELSREQVQYARSLLEAERKLLLPSKYQLIGYRMFNGVAMTLLMAIAIGGLGVVAAELPGLEMGLAVGCISLYVIAGLTFLLVPMFLLNLPLVRKFWRLASFRRDLGLGAALTSAFHSERKRKRVRNLLTGLGVLVGLGLVIWSVVAFFADHLDSARHGAMDIEDILLVAVPFMIGLSFFSLHYMRRAKERLAVVAKILDSLADGVAGSSEGAEAMVSLPAGSYKAVARLERENIYLDRQRSIRAASKATGASQFALQRSHEVQAALADLDHETRHTAEEAMFSLIENATPPESSVDSETRLHVLPIGESSWELLYEVDRELMRIRVHLARDSAGESGTQ